jgi:hypothetical protein
MATCGDTAQTSCAQCARAIFYTVKRGPPPKWCELCSRERKSALNREREKSRPPRIRSPDRDRNAGPVRECVICGSQFRRPARTRRDSGKACSRECGFTLRWRNAAAGRRLTEERKVYRRWARQAERRARVVKLVDAEPRKACKDCGVEYIPRPYQHRCDECRDARAPVLRERSRKSPAYRRAKRMSKARRRAVERGIEAERFDPLEIFARDGWRCHICGIATPKRLRGTCDARAPELDHIQPLAAGGKHTRINTACSCRKCNGTKGAKPLGQLRLVA